MKKNLMLLLSVVLTTGAMAMSDGDGLSDDRVAVLNKGDNVFGVIYKSEMQSDVTISIYNAKDQLVFTEKFRKSDSFLRPYNFTGLDFGEYIIEVKDSRGTSINEVTHKKQRIEKIVNVVKVSAAEREDKFLFTAAGKGEEVLYLNIYDDAGKLLYNEAKRVTGLYGKVYTLRDIKGGCMFEVIHQNGSVKQLRYP